MSPNELEAWKAVTEFSKTVLSLSATVLAALASYIVLERPPVGLIMAVSPALLVLAVIFSLYGFGGAIKALKSGTSQKIALLGCNAGAVALLCSIVLLPLTLKSPNHSIDGILSLVEATTKTYAVSLSAANCKEISKVQDAYKLRYVIGGTSIEAIYSLSENIIVSIK